MAFLLRRLLISVLVPFLWKRWRERSRTGTVPDQRVSART